MARKKKPPVDLGDPDYLPPQLITGETDEQRDGEVAARIREELIKIMNAMGDLPSISEGDSVPNIRLMRLHYNTLGLYLDKLEQRLRRYGTAVKKGTEAKQTAKRTSKVGMSNDFD